MAAKTSIFFVIDDSGSMRLYSPIVRDAIKSITIEKNTKDKIYDFNYISFSCKPEYSKNLDSLPIAGYSTNIEAAFSLLNEKVLLGSSCDELIIIFISDGHDNDRRTIDQRLHRLGGTRDIVPTTFFTVAVGDGFPTSMVVSSLRPNYHTASDCLPLVFPVTATDQVMDVFGQMTSYIFYKDHFNVSMEFDESASLSELEEGVDAIYNYYTVKCSNEKNVQKCLALINQAKALLERMLKVAKAKEEEKKVLLNVALKDDAKKPLASNILRATREQRKKVHTTILDCLTKFNSYYKSTMEGNLLSNLSDIEKQKILSYGNVVGKHLVKSLKYNSADFERTKSHLHQALKNYDDNQEAADKEVVDYVITQAEALIDARECADALVQHAESIVSIVDTLAVVGRLMNVKTCDGTQINPYLVEVVSLPKILQHMNSIDFFGWHSGVYNDKNREGEVGNCLLPITKNQSPNNFLRGPLGAHICTYILCKNPDLCFHNAMVAMQAALVSYCLTKLDGFHAGVLEETYTSFKSINSPENKPQLFEYIQHVASDKFREALVTESDDLPKAIKCQHLSKFVFAMYVNICQGIVFTTESLIDRMHACMVEMVGRSGTYSIYDYISYRKINDMDYILNQMPIDDALKAFTLHEGNKIFANAVKTALKSSDLCAIEDVRGPQDIPVTYMGFSRASISVIFSNLNKLAGNPSSDEFELPSVQKRLSIFAHGLSKSSYDRNITHPSVPSITNMSLKDDLEQSYRNSVCNSTEEFFAEKFKNMFEKNHYDIAIMPPEYRAMYKSQTGKDVTKDFSVSEETWLSTVACMAPGCPNFMGRMGKAVTTQEDKPMICNELLHHLQIDPLFVPSMARCAMDLVREGRIGEHDLASAASNLSKGCMLRDGKNIDRQKKQVAEIVENFGGVEKLCIFLREAVEDYSKHKNKMTYDEFKGMMDRAYTLPLMQSAAVGIDDATE